MIAHTFWVQVRLKTPLKASKIENTAHEICGLKNLTTVCP